MAASGINVSSNSTAVIVAVFSAVPTLNFKLFQNKNMASIHNNDKTFGEKAKPCSTRDCDRSFNLVAQDDGHSVQPVWLFRHGVVNDLEQQWLLVLASTD